MLVVLHLQTFYKSVNSCKRVINNVANTASIHWAVPIVYADIGNFASQDLDILVRGFAPLRRLRKYPQFLLVIMHGKLTVSANLRDSQQESRRKIFKSWLPKLPRSPGGVRRAVHIVYADT